jgi:hypothetical protein
MGEEHVFWNSTKDEKAICKNFKERIEARAGSLTRELTGTEAEQK